MGRRILLTTLAAGLVCAKPAAARVAVVATGTNDVALLDVVTDRVVARPVLPGPSRAVAASRGGRLAVIARGARKPDPRPLELGRGVGGAVAASPDGSVLAVGAAAGGARAALVGVAARDVRRFRSGRGPGAPGWSPDGARVYLA